MQKRKRFPFAADPEIVQREVVRAVLPPLLSHVGPPERPTEPGVPRRVRADPEGVRTRGVPLEPQGPRGPRGPGQAHDGVGRAGRDPARVPLVLDERSRSGAISCQLWLRAYQMLGLKFLLIFERISRYSPNIFCHYV